MESREERRTVTPACLCAPSGGTLGSLSGDRFRFIAACRDSKGCILGCLKGTHVGGREVGVPGRPGIFQYRPDKNYLYEGQKGKVV